MNTRETPETKAARRLLSDIFWTRSTNWMRQHVEEALPSIESEAVSLALSGLAEAVKGLPAYPVFDDEGGRSPQYGHLVHRAAVIQLIRDKQGRPEEER